MKNIITPKEFEERMQHISETFGENSSHTDKEEFHIQADKLLIETLNSLGYQIGCDIFESEPKYYV